MYKVITAIFVCFLCEWIERSDGSDAYHYDYSDPVIEDLKTVAGSRLINARAADANEFQFVGALYITSAKHITSPTCSSSLISPDYALSSTHCLYFETDLPGKSCNKQLIKIQKGSYISHEVRCELLPSNDVKIWIEPTSDKAYILFNVGDAKKKTDGTHDPKGIISYVDFFIRPFNSYDNKNNEIYLKRGGQDILLIKLMEKTLMKPICLPGPKLKDTVVKATLAGYGQYFRSSCLTDSNGPMKYHYCVGESVCFEHNCKPTFSDGLKNYTGCAKVTTPAKWSRLCSRFFFKIGYKFPSNVNEVHLLHISKKSPGKGEFLETCYRQEPGPLGWCRTKGNYYKLKQQEKETRIATDWGWGFCSDECDQQGESKDRTGILRKQPGAFVFDEAYCEGLLDDSREIGKTFKYRPKLLCVGKQIKISYEVYFSEDVENKATDWLKIENDYLEKNPQIIKTIYEKNMVDPDGNSFYETSVGSCKGDSGGPMIIEGMNDKTHTMQNVLIGVVRGGLTNGLKECGGINNPTAYTRVKSLVKWIMEMTPKLDHNNICFAN